VFFFFFFLNNFNKNYKILIKKRTYFAKIAEVTALLTPQTPSPL